MNAKNPKARKLIRMQNLRRLAQMLSFLGFLYLFVLTIGSFETTLERMVLASKAPIDTFFRVDPLLGLTTMLSTRSIIPIMLIYSAPVIMLSVLAGRFFCGWICPLGTALDATDSLFFRKRVNQAPNSAVRNLKFYILGAIIVAAVFASQTAYLLDPITIITRAFTFLVFPSAQLAARALRDAGLIKIRSAYLPSDVAYFFRLNFFAAVVFFGILAAEAVSRRFWCRNLCPLGALLGLLSRFSAVRRLVRSDCISCRKCVKDCKTGAVLDDPAQYRAPECIYCYSCTPICPTRSTRIVPTIETKGYHGELDLSRRKMLLAGGIGVLAAALSKTNAAAKTSTDSQTKISSPFLLRPPRALPEDEFVNRCLRCSECMKVCPTNGLQPAITEAGFAGMWTPVLVPRIGECTQQCNLCSQVCSSQAIQPFTVAEKSHIYIGTAVIDRSACIAWNSDKQCLVCGECCSYHALQWRMVDDVKRPFVDDHKCVGCGICENACPIQPVAAIRVNSFGDKRSSFES